MGYKLLATRLFFFWFGGENESQTRPPYHVHKKPKCEHELMSC